MPPAVGRYARTVRGLRPAQLAARVRLRGQRAAIARFPALFDLAIARGAPPVSGAGWPANLLPFDGRCRALWPDRAELAAGRITLLGETRQLFQPGAGPASADWAQPDRPLLWRYHLHYWDWAWALASPPGPALPPAEPGRPGPLGAGWPVGAGSGGAGAGRGAAGGGDLFVGLYRSWRLACLAGPGRAGVAWSPYVASLRAWSLCALRPLLAAGTLADAWLGLDLGAHRVFLRAHLERDVGGNHLVKNLKALVALAVAAGDGPDADHWAGQLCHEADRQVLPDGGHAERAPAYHCQVLADLLDVTTLLAAAGRPVPARLADAVARMRGWLAAVRSPDGSVPLLNDGFPVPATAVDLLLDSAQPAGAAAAPPRPAERLPRPPAGGQPAPGPARQAAEQRWQTRAPAPRPAAAGGASLRLLADSGLAVLRAGGWRLLADVGLPCPDDLPAHAHADSLGFLLWHDDTALLVDTGTSTYEPGRLRDTERGTAAHSTVVLDGADSTEVWGAFRAGRRARPRLLEAGFDAGAVVLAAEHDGYRHLPGRPRHRRTWRLAPDRLEIVDVIDSPASRAGALAAYLGGGGGREHRADILFQLAPGLVPVIGGAGTPAGRGGDALAAHFAGPDGGPVLTALARAECPLPGGPDGGWRSRTTHRAAGWNRMVPALTAVFSVRGRLPLRVRTVLTLAATLPPVPAPAVGADTPVPRHHQLT
ncbi:MAG: alginate lyase family protein [Frankia sp.]|nr:alginate lyase family protein [Frankia sp.]